MSELGELLKSYSFIIVILLFVILHLGVEAYTHRRNLRRIPIRIHVNGSQGKSTVTRLIAAGLREHGFRVCAKTAGALPCFIRPDGTEQAIYRSSGSDVMELAKIVRTAANLRPEILVISCSTYKPELQSLAELSFIKSTHGIITNILEERLDIMGPTHADVALALAGTIPVRGKLYTAEHHHLRILRMAAKERGTKITLIKSNDIQAIDKNIISQFNYIEYINHPEHLAVALKVCKDLGVSKQTALQGMYKASPDPESITIHFLEWKEQPIVFVNAFSINDPEQALPLWEKISQQYSNCSEKIILFNCRKDRKERSQKYARAINEWDDVNAVFVLGGGKNSFIDNINNPAIKVINASSRTPSEILNAFITTAKNPSLVVGLGNIVGAGFKIFEYFTHLPHTIIKSTEKSALPAE